jgi:hypothetical protein
MDHDQVGDPAVGLLMLSSARCRRTSAPSFSMENHASVRPVDVVAERFLYYVRADPRLDAALRVDVTAGEPARSRRGQPAATDTAGLSVGRFRDRQRGDQLTVAGTATVNRAVSAGLMVDNYRMMLASPAVRCLPAQLLASHRVVRWGLAPAGTRRRMGGSQRDGGRARLSGVAHIDNLGREGRGESVG